MSMIFLGMFTNLDAAKAEQLSELLGIEIPIPADPEPPIPADPEPERERSVGRHFDRAPGLAQELIRMHFPRASWERMASIGECESNWHPRAHNTSGEDSRGWFQINIGPGANTDMAGLDLFDPVVNVEQASIIWKRQGYDAWRNCSRLKGIPLTGGGVV